MNLAGSLSLLESAELMRGATMNYVNDSAPMHLCSSVNAPVTAIFCSTIPSFGFGPLSENSRIIETKEELPCRPCGLHGFKTCPKGHFLCAESIKPENVLSN
jgi:heptosyltransferase-2